ncbi:MAG: FAD-dependent oxidoreductase [Legionella sp.]|jgi:NTE family protein
MTKETDYLLLGGGLASAFNAESLRRDGARGRIIIVGEENFHPYYRPQLARSFLLGGRKIEQMEIYQREFYKENNIELICGTKVTAVDPKNKTVKTDRAGIISFQKMLIATGCSPKKVEIPGNKLAGVHYLRTILDAEPIVKEIEAAKHIVIYGGSYIGIEIASLLSKKNVKSTIITEKFTLFNVSPSEAIATFLKNHGIKVLLKQTIKKFKGKQHVNAVETSSGKTIECDCVIIAEDHVPNTDFLKGSGIKVDDGVLVDRFLCTNIEDIYAAGDVAKFYDPVFKKMHRNGGVDNAMKQGRLAAQNMMGMRRSYITASYFYIQAFDNSIVIIGDTDDCDEKLTRGSLDDKNIALLYLKNGYLHGGFFSGRPVEEIKAAESLIINRVNIKPYKKQLCNLKSSLEVMAKQKILALQGGGALGAFECGVVRAMEEYGIYPDIVSGISIGAFNSAIIAANPRNAAGALDAFWSDISAYTVENPDEQARRLMASWQSIAFGSPNFFYPRWLMPITDMQELPVNWTSFYDTSFMLDLLHKYIDFEKLESSPVRLLVMAVNVETSEFDTFDSYTDIITPQHILASGSLPPGFPWTTIDNKHYWDGGIVTNTPIDATLDICGSTNKEIYIVELYSRKRSLPRNMIEVLARKDEILFSEKIRKDIHARELVCNYKKLLERILSFCDPELVAEIKQFPAYIQMMGDPGIVATTRIIREIQQDEPYSWDSDFSIQTIEQHKISGYETALRTLADMKGR